jgi:hypothetical protein
MRAFGQDRAESTCMWMKGVALEDMDGGMRQIKITGACRGVDGAWGVAGTCMLFAWQEGVTAIVISWRRFCAIVALLVLYGIYGLPGLEGGVALSVALLELQAQFLTKPLAVGSSIAFRGATPRKPAGLHLSSKSRPSII